MAVERLLMAIRRSSRRVFADSEPVLVTIHDGRCELTTDEGVAYDFDLGELRTALQDGEAA